MSIHFAPQWVKPIKPSGTSLTPTSDNPPSTISSGTIKSLATPVTAQTPFPALSNSSAARSGSPTTNATPNQVLSYSRVTHTPLSPNFPSDSSYFPYTEPNGAADPKLAFRYSREQMLGMWEEEKVRELPIEMVQLLEDGGVLVSKSVVKPVGLREQTEVEKKLLATTVHPPALNRRQPTNPPGEAQANGPAARRPLGPPNGKDGAVIPNGRAGFGGFGRGEGGALGGGAVGRFGTIGNGALGGGAGEGRAPGALGGGFGGVGKRIGARRAESGEIGPDVSRLTGPTWRQNRTTSGSFEGVLGFGGAAAPTASVQPSAPGVSDSGFEAVPQTVPVDGAWRARFAEAPREGEEEKKVADGAAFGSGGGPGWGTGQKKWRTTAGQTGQGDTKVVPPNVPTSSLGQSSDSTRATPSAPLLPERDAAVGAVGANATSLTRQSSGHGSQQESREDLAAVQWYYRDPNDVEQGPFGATVMHDWYSHSYFKDHLPVRRATESTFHSLAELKAATGNAVQPFLSPVRPRVLPPNLPLPAAAFAATSPGINGQTPLVDSFKSLPVPSPAPADQRISPAPQYGAFNSPFSPNQFPPQPFNQINSPGFVNPPVQPWNAVGAIGSPMHQGSFGFGARPGFSQQQQPQQPYSPVIGGPAQRDPFGPNGGVGFGGIPTGSWGAHQPAQTFPAHQSQPPQPPLPPYPAQQEQVVQAPIEAESVKYEPSYFAPAEEATSQVQEAAVALEPKVDNNVETVAGSSVAIPPVSSVEVEADAKEASPLPKPDVEHEAVLVPQQSVWGQKSKDPLAPPSGKSSILVTEPTPSQAAAAPAAPASTAVAAKLPPAPASLPAKPVSTRSGSISESLPAKPAVSPVTPTPASATVTAPEKAPVSKPAPWAVTKDDSSFRAASTGPSLREIQEAEAKQAEARRAALAEARAAAASPSGPAPEDVPSSLSWGLPSSGSGKASAVSTPAMATPPTPVWGGGDAAPKKTLKQIQEEEEKRKTKIAQHVAQVKAAAVPGASAVPKRGYADLAANAAPTAAAPGWTTVGAGGKSALASTVPGAAPRTAAAPVSKPAAVPPPRLATPAPVATQKPKANGTAVPAEDLGPSVEFIRWTKAALTGLTVNVDEFIQMLLSFPADPPASQKSDVAEIIADSVYASSSTLDGRRFASEWMTRRKADASRPNSGSSIKGLAATAAGKVGGTSLADVVKMVPKPQSAESGFKIVKTKGKKKI